MPDDMKAFFRPNIGTTLQKPMKMIGFQHSQQLSLFKLARDSVSWRKFLQRFSLKFALILQKVKNKKIIQVKAQLEEEIRQIKIQYDAMLERRKAMQQKLLQIHERNQQKKKEMLYRNPVHVSGSSSFSLASRSPSFTSSPSMNQSGPNFASTSSAHSGQSPSFFNKNAPMFNNVTKTPNSASS
jgi:hypothetical protein